MNKTVSSINKSQCFLKNVKVFTFDAYNTLYSPTLPVMEQYSIVGKKYGINVDSKVLTKKFHSCFSEINKEYPRYGKYKNISASDWWGKLIIELFKPNTVPDEMINEILVRFEGKMAYTVYDDIVRFLTYIKQKHPEIIIGIISNTDPICKILLGNLGLYKFFDSEDIYLSYDLDISKPNPEIFNYCFNDICRRYPHLKKVGVPCDQLKKLFWHIGDEPKNDFEGSQLSGWSSILINRFDLPGISANPKVTLNYKKNLSTNTDAWVSRSTLTASSSSQKGVEMSFITDNQIVVSNLDVLTDYVQAQES
ncbi:hypothetical protein TBLA_0H00260 [Henningerozyma blattae CBS 6284]|uniref:Uncharacterized protein n=1 Tax=Henningerozyma blattae (strain ATCC 34711 / CBS 6284 / DSM 70876 / NBRC 10599 / NRRL Y-10934 / UCD 77-7) TaxID=1071380 RepID=I2H7G7_HENB6|nr:hypothetical protein TBLA_0H00260 [Tetrapisispora blattae CBS 6284]CCH62319.1 hypothetical protein TBLA_0H00260 [Tetrapisispora blattae CBS 6284]